MKHNQMLQAINRSESGQLQVVPVDEDEELCVMGDTPPLLPCDEVLAVFTNLQRTLFKPYKQEKFVFELTVFSPEKFEGVKLEMFARIDPSWKSPPRSSKLWKIIQIVTDGEFRKRQRVTKNIFIGKAFRCKLKTVGEGPAAYSIIEMIVEKIAG